MARKRRNRGGQRRPLVEGRNELRPRAASRVDLGRDSRLGRLPIGNRPPGRAPVGSYTGSVARPVFPAEASGRNGRWGIPGGLGRFQEWIWPQEDLWRQGELRRFHFGPGG